MLIMDKVLHSQVNGTLYTLTHQLFVEHYTAMIRSVLSVCKLMKVLSVSALTSSCFDSLRSVVKEDVLIVLVIRI